jgi:hypothetical protein
MSLRENISEAFASCVRFQAALAEIALLPSGDESAHAMREIALRALADRNRPTKIIPGPFR